MPIYLYEVLNQQGEVEEVVELMQSMQDEPFTTHPDSGKPVRRIVARPNVPKGYYPQSGEAQLKDGNLERLGFTKYVKAGDGRYEKTAGDSQTPDTIYRGGGERAT